MASKNETAKVYDQEYLVRYLLSFESDIKNDVAPCKGTLVMNVVGEPVFEELEERIKKYVFRLNEREIPMNKITVKVIRVERLDHWYVKVSSLAPCKIVRQMSGYFFMQKR